MWRCFHSNCPLLTTQKQYLVSGTPQKWLCCIPPNHTPEMIDPFLVLAADVILEGVCGDWASLPAPSLGRYARAGALPY